MSKPNRSENRQRSYYRGDLRWFGVCFLFLAALLLTTGCGGGGPAANTVSGKVTFNAKPVAGMVSFVYSDNKEVNAPINPDGSYSVLNPAPGQVKIVVKGMPGVGPVVGAPKGSPDLPTMPGTAGASQGVPPPAKYATAATSDLTYDVKPGKHTHNIELKP